MPPCLRRVKEHSTSAWILEGLLARTGFAIEAADRQDPAYADHLCIKEQNCGG